MSTTEESPVPTRGAPSSHRGVPVHTEDDELEEAGDWDEEPLRRRPRRRLLTPLSALLFALLVGAGGFIAGVLVEKGQVPTASAAGGGRLASLLGGAASATTGTGGRSAAAGSSEGASGGGAARFGAGGGAFGAGGGALGANATVGQVANISGSDLYVTEPQGNTIKVAASAAHITKQVSTSVRGVHPGDTVVVQGTHRSDGSIEAATVRDSGSAGAAAGGIGALLGGGGSASTSGAGSARAGSSGTAGGGGGRGEPALFGR